MRVILLLSLFLLQFNLCSQEEPKRFFLRIGIGADGLLKKPSEPMDFGIDLSLNNLNPGMSFSFYGLDWYPHRLIGIHLSGASANFFVLKDANVLSQLQSRYADKEVMLDFASSNAVPYIKLGVSYTFLNARGYLSPMLSFGWQSAWGINVRYALRVPQTNYFSDYLIHTSGVNPSFTAGLEFVPVKHSMFGFHTSVCALKNNAVHEVTVENHLGERVKSTIHDTKFSVIWNVGVFLRFNPQ